MIVHSLKESCVSTEGTTPQQTVGCVVEAAAFLFDLHGWYDVNIADIANEAEVSEPTVLHYFAAKRIVALAAYDSVLRDVLADARSKQDAREALITFVVRLNGAIWAHPALATALLPMGRDHSDPGAEPLAPSSDVKFVDFEQLAEVLAELLNEHWMGRRGHPDYTIYAAEMYLAGLLSWALMHKEKVHDAASAYLLYQLL